MIILHRNISCCYSLELPHHGTSNEWPQPNRLLRTDRLYFEEVQWSSGRASDLEREVGGSILTQVAVLYP